MAPDGTFSTTIPNNWFTTYLQRRGGLNISVAHTAAACAGGSRGGCRWDKLANDVEHNRRHNSTLNKSYDMVSAVAIGQVGKGDKADKLSAVGAPRAPLSTSSSWRATRSLEAMH